MQSQLSRISAIPAVKDQCNTRQLSSSFTCGEGEEGGSLGLLEGQVYGAEQRPLHPSVQHKVGVSEICGGDSSDTVHPGL